MIPLKFEINLSQHESMNSVTIPHINIDDAKALSLRGHIVVAPQVRNRLELSNKAGVKCC